MKKIILINIIFLNLLFSQQTPAPAQDKSVLIYGGTTHVGNGELINNSLIGFTNGKIDLIASTDLAWSDNKLNSFQDSKNEKYDTQIMVKQYLKTSQVHGPFLRMFSVLVWSNTCQTNEKKNS